MKTSDKTIIRISMVAGCLAMLPMVSSAAAFSAAILSLFVSTAIGVPFYRRHLRMMDANTTQAETAAQFQAIPCPQGVLSLHDGQLQFWTRESAQPSPVGITPDEDQAAMQQAIPMIRGSLSLVLLGSQGTGKTTLLCHLIDARSSDGETIIIDPHGYSGKYGDHPIVGTGRAYGDIDQCLIDLMDELNRRYAMYQGQDFPKLHIYVDETTLLKKNCGAFSSFMEVALTEFRKVGMRLTLCLHSRRAKFLGLHGAMDLAEGIDWLTLKNETGQRWGELETDGGNIQLALPGPYRGGCGSHTPGHGHAVTPETSLNTGFNRPHTPHDPLNTHDHMTLDFDPEAGAYAQYDEPQPRRFYESKRDKTINEMADSGESYNTIARKIWGFSNGKKTAIIKKILTHR